MGFIRENIRNPELRKYMGLARELTPINAVNASGLLTFNGVVADGQTVTIGTSVYEFDTNATVTAGNIAVDVSGGVTAGDACTALIASITANADSVVNASQGAGTTVVIVAKTKGSSYNATATTETCTNGSFGSATLTGGVAGTAGLNGELAIDAGSLYIFCKADNLSESADGWRQAFLEPDGNLVVYDNDTIGFTKALKSVNSAVALTTETSYQMVHGTGLKAEIRSTLNADGQGSGNIDFYTHGADGNFIKRMRINYAGISLEDGFNIAGGGISGSTFGISAGNKIGFHGATPSVQNAFIANPTDLATCITAITSILTVLKSKGLIASA